MQSNYEIVSPEEFSEIQGGTCLPFRPGIGVFETVLIHFRDQSDLKWHSGDTSLLSVFQTSSQF